LFWWLFFVQFYSARLSKSERKGNLAEEILADDRIRPYLKRKFTELQDDARKKGKAMFNKKVHCNTLQHTVARCNAL